MENIENKNEFISKRMKELAGNIDSFDVGEIVIDSDGSECEITNKTKNSIEVFIKKKNSSGVSHNEWFTIQDFNKRFKKK